MAYQTNGAIFGPPCMCKRILLAAVRSKIELHGKVSDGSILYTTPVAFIACFCNPSQKVLRSVMFVCLLAGSFVNIRPTAALAGGRAGE